MHFPYLLLESAHPSGASLVRDMLVILGAAAVISVLLHRLRLASIPGYLIVGALIGSLPQSWGLIGEHREGVEQIQEIAIILLMFTIGLHLEVEAISSGMVPILVVGAASTIGSSLVMWPLGMLFGLSAPAALGVAMALSMSSTAVVLGLLQQRKEVHLLHGRLCIGISIMQDMLSIAVLASLPILAVWAGVKPSDDATAVGGAEKVMQLASHAGLAIGGIILMVGFAHYLLPGLLREASRDGNTEALLVVSAGAGLGAAVLTTALGFGPALGAFLAGFMLSATPFKYQLAGQLAPMRDLFMAVFFTAVGVQLNVVNALHSWWIVLIAVVLVMGIKAFVIGASVWFGGATAAIGGLTGLLLAQAGEFSLVILGEAKKGGLVDPKAQGIIIPLVVISLMLTEPAANLARRLSPRLAKIKPARWLASPALRERAVKHAVHEATGTTWVGAAGTGEPVRRHVIIAGFGIVGRNLAEHFAAREIPYTVIELNPDTVQRQQALGRTTVFGDATNPDVLESAGLESAEAVVITIPDDEATVRACRLVRQTRPDVFIAVRAGYLGRAIAAHEGGADHVTIEEVVTAQDMAVKVVAELERRFALREKQVPHM
jgi:CPA2 family monovalent cation:H+ antiporter-2